MKIPRVITFLLLPAIALGFGWKLGANYEWNQLQNERGRIQELFTVSGSGQTVKTDPEKEVNLSLFWSVWRLLGTHYVDPSKLETRMMVEGAISGMVDAVGDPYTLFMTAKDTEDFQHELSGTLEGIGAQLDATSGEVVVVTPLKGSPAERAGLQPNDVILAVNGQELKGLLLDKVVSLIRGPKGTSVKLSVLSKGAKEPRDVTVIRDAIHIPSVESKIIKTQTGSIGLVALNQFGDDSVPELRKAILGMAGKDLKGLVLDLRYNGGGYLEGAVDLVSMFVATGNVVSVESRDAPVEIHKVTGDVLAPSIPLVVLINGGSASASEITAGALQDVKRATIIGTQSYGKGTVQEILDLPGGAALRVTIARWLTPSGHDLGKKGVTPDFVVDRTLEQYKAAYDPQLLAAEAFLTVGKKPAVKVGTGSVK